jgi:hypothetical protein
MPGGFAPRFAIEAGFLILLGVGAGYADLRPIVIVGLLAGGWVLVSLVELAVWRSQARPVGAYVPPAPPPAEEEEIEVEVEPEVVPEPEPELVAERDVVADPGPVEDEYPLRADAGEVPSEEVEEYTRVIARAEDEASREDSQ